MTPAAPNSALPLKAEKGTGHSQEWLCHEPQKQKGPEGK
jgi:hypothetical protein